MFNNVQRKTAIIFKIFRQSFLRGIGTDTFVKSSYLSKEVIQNLFDVFDEKFRLLKSSKETEEFSNKIECTSFYLYACNIGILC